MAFRLGNAVVLALATFVAAAPAAAEIEKFLLHCEQKLCPFFRASLTIPNGWQEDTAATTKLKVRVLVPRGRTYDNAEALIYANVRFNPDKKSVADFIADDEAHWRSSAPDAKITALPDVARANGKEPFRMREFEVPSRKSQPFERVATTTDVDKDGNPYLVGIVLSALSRNGLRAAEPPYLAVLKAY